MCLVVTCWERADFLALLNRKFHISQNSHCWYQFFTAREELVPMGHIFHTNISHFVKFAHVLKLYVAYMRNLRIDKKNTPNLLHFAIDSNSSHICQDFITRFKQIKLLKGHNEILLSGYYIKYNS